MGALEVIITEIRNMKSHIIEQLNYCVGIHMHITDRLIEDHKWIC